MKPINVIKRLNESANELDDLALWVYKNTNRDEEWDKFTDDELVELISLCCITDKNPGGRAYDDEVFDAAERRPNGDELIKKGQALAKGESTIKEDNVSSNDDIQVYMNTWKNYNEYGADLEQYGIKDGWMSPEEAKEFAEKYAEDEPFINDTDNCPFEGVNEYSSLSVLDDLITYNNLSEDEKEVVGAILEAGSITDLEEAIHVAETGDYVFFPGVDNDEDLGRAYVDMCGGITSAVSQSRLPEFFDEEGYREEIEDDVRDMIASDNGYDSIDDVTDEELNSYLDAIVSDELSVATLDGNEDFLEAHFDYKAFGEELSYDYTYVDAGAICTF